MATAGDPEPQPDERSPAEAKYANCPDEAERRSGKYRAADPFPDIPRALLSSEHIKAYVRETGMIHPFDDGPGALKAASYEVRAWGKFIYWDKDGKKILQSIERDGTFTLPPNSISYVQIESEFRLPQYIAVRFNLRISHVHRGLLLGTGPLVDPGFHGRLLVPLHNLTSDEYTIRGDEGLIWMEFTKTSHTAKNACVTDAPQDEISVTELRKNNQPPDYYFDRASKNRPIRSSIPVVVADAERLAREADSAAKRAERTIGIFVGVGILAIVGVVVGLFSLLTAVNTNVVATHNLIKNVSDQARQAASDSKRAEDDIRDLRSQIGREVEQMQQRLTELQQRAGQPNQR
jgi:deoxycytidine triphosphate deaminase